MHGKAKLPDFIVVGPPRTGSSWLHRAFVGHVGLPRGRKETKFFTENHFKGLEWYADCFRSYPPGLTLAEVCPQYFAFDEARERIRHYLPNCQIVCTLRDPVDRLYSHWRFLVRNAYFEEPPTFEQAVVTSALSVHAHYASNVVAWRRLFGAERVLVTIYDDLRRDPQAYLDRITTFVGIHRIEYTKLPSKLRAGRVNTATHYSADARRRAAAEQFRAQLKRVHLYKLVQFWGRRWLWNLLAGAHEEFPPLDPALAMRLRERMRPDVEALERLLAIDLSCWKDSSAARSF